MSSPRGDDDIILGVFASPHGVRGLVKVKSFTDDALSVGSYGPVLVDDGRILVLETRGMVKGLVLVSVEGVASRDDAAALRGQSFSVSRDALPRADADEIYQADLIGARVEDDVLGEIGEVRGVFDFGGGAMLEVMRASGKSVLVPIGGERAFRFEDGKIFLSVDPVWLEEDK